jgi:hypothetical protein
MIEKQLTMFKGELMEELLRNYFLSLGYYVVRGAKLRYENIDFTDIDLFLYARSFSLTRERINVDIKNKKSPQAFDRIVWANGIMKILDFDSCIVATTDTRSLVHSFAQSHKTTILDGAFLQKLRSASKLTERLSEEEFINKIVTFKSYKTFPNKDWRFIYEQLKSKLLTELDFSGFNSSLESLNYFIEKSLTDEQKREGAIRMTYIVISYLLVIMDFIVKDTAFLEQKDREKILSNGLKFGNLGKEGVDKIIQMAVTISGNSSASAVIKSLENIPVDILKDFFIRFENSRNLFEWSKEFETISFKRELMMPDKLNTSLKSVLSVMLDFLQIERKKYFSTLQGDVEE